MLYLNIAARPNQNHRTDDMPISTILLYVVIVFAVLVAIALVWRLYSHRQSLPCPAWLGWMVEMDNPVLRSNRSSVIISHLELLPGMKVLDLGCGPGRLSIPLAKQLGSDGEVVAADVQPEMLQRVIAKAETAGIGNIRYLEIRAESGDLGSNEYDRALLVTVLGEIPDKAYVLTSIFEALKPGGILSITEAVADPHFLSRKTVRQLATDAGFMECGFWGHRFAYNIHFRRPKVN